MNSISRRGFLLQASGSLGALALSGRLPAAGIRRQMAFAKGGRLERLDPPAFLDDFGGDAQLLEGWSRRLSAMFDRNKLDAKNRAEQLGVGRPVLQFYNPVLEDTDDDAVTAAIRWRASPNILNHEYPDPAARRAEADRTRMNQDEYCEWCVERGGDGKIRRVTFTCEGPDYWEYLAEKDPDAVLRLYREFVSKDVQHRDLFDARGVYLFSQKKQKAPASDTWNNFENERGVLGMHLIQPNNNLFAEINIVAMASLRWVHGETGRPYTSAQELIQEAEYGELLRNSDPHIGDVVNQLARLRADVTLANPVALYIDGLNTAGWETPDGSDAQEYWTVLRGTPEHTVRAKYEVPAGKSFTVGDVRIDGRPIEYGAQIAEHISMRATGVACRFGKSEARPVVVRGDETARGRFLPPVGPLGARHSRRLRRPA